MTKIIRKKLITILIIIAFILGMSFVLYNNVMERQKNDAYTLLEDSAKTVSKEITMKFKDDITGLELIANAMEQENKISPNQLGFLHLDSYRKTTLFSRIDIIYSDNTVLLEDNTRIPLRDEVDFDDLFSKGDHMSHRMKDTVTKNESVYYFKPVKIDDNNRAILVGVVDTTTLSKIMKPTIYNGKAVCCLIDGNDGNFIMDNWHDSLGNAFSMEDRKRLKEFENIDLKFEIKNQKSGLIAFESNTNGKDIYMYYLPIDMFNWHLEVFTQDDVIFQNLYHTRKILFVAGGIEIILLGLYFFWNVITIKRLAKKEEETAHQLEISNTLIQCATELSSDKDVKVSIGYILKTINHFYNADTAYIYELDSNNRFVCTYKYIENFSRVKFDNEIHILEESTCTQCFKSDKIYYISCDDNCNCPNECQTLESYKINNFLGVPLSKQGDLKGFIGLTNIKQSFNEKEFLISVRYFITSRLSMLKTQSQLKYLSYKDLLTSMYNRNKYIDVIDSYKNKQLCNVGCAYIDLNGLKKTNDLHGHEQGDKIIRDTARIIKRYFYHKAYRVGGDEFVIIDIDVDENEFYHKISKLKDFLSQKQLSASVGYLWMNNCDDLEKALKSADEMMYEEKKNYHQHTNN